MKNLLLILLCSTVLASCASNNGPPKTTIANSTPPAAKQTEGLYDCSTDRATKIPSDAELKEWDVVKMFAWGEASWKWGDYCANKLSMAEHVAKCKDGDKLECTFVRQALATKK